MKAKVFPVILLFVPSVQGGFGLNKNPHLQIKSSRSSSEQSHVLLLFSSSNPHNGDNGHKKNTTNIVNRRQTLIQLILQPSILGITTVASLPTQNQAACLPGDTSMDCIGVYKVPIDEAIKGMIDTPEQLAKFAPGLRWTEPIEYPKNYKVAKDEILDLQSKVQELIPIVSKGDLTSAGVELLRIVPRITVAGRVIIGSLNNVKDFSMKAFRAEVAHNELLASLGAVDVLIGQSFAGQLGSVTAAQIQILEELRSAIEHYDELIKAIPEGYSG